MVECRLTRKGDTMPRVEFKGPSHQYEILVAEMEKSGIRYAMEGYYGWETAVQILEEGKEKFPKFTAAMTKWMELYSVISRTIDAVTQAAREEGMICDDEYIGG